MVTSSTITVDHKLFLRRIQISKRQLLLLRGQGLFRNNQKPPFWAPILWILIFPGSARSPGETPEIFALRLLHYTVWGHTLYELPYRRPDLPIFTRLRR